MADESIAQKVRTACLFILTVIAVGAALAWLRPVLIPFVLALFLAYILVPLMDALQRRARLPRLLAILVTLGLGALVFTMAAAFLSMSVRQLARNAPAYQDKLVDLTAWAAALLERLGLEQGAEAIELQLAALPIGDLLVATANAVLDTLSNGFLILIFVVYLLLGHGRSRAASSGLLVEIDRRIQRYLATKVAVSAVTGLLVGLILYLLGVELAVVFGVLAFLLNFIPTIGSVVATLLPLPILLVTPDVSTVVIVLALLLPGAVQVTVGSVIEPYVMGRSLDLHPVTILLALMFWGMLWGIWGMVLATPITAVLKILAEELELTRPIARLMAGDLHGRDSPPEPSAAADPR